MVPCLFEEDITGSILPILGAEEMSDGTTKTTIYGTNMAQTISTIEAKRESIGAGSIVTLKTGGPAMVVSERSTDKACCHWHEESGELNTMWIPLCCLKVKP